jgi:hypothetical protein
MGFYAYRFMFIAVAPAFGGKTVLGAGFAKSILERFVAVLM